MGYYDEHYQQTRSKRGSKKGYMFAGFIGGIMGAVIVLVSMPFLSQFSWWPIIEETEPVKEESVATMGGTNGSPELENPVSMPVNTSISDAVDKVSKAVVGVINLKQTSFFSEPGNEGTGSGVIYKKADGKAYVVTNHHVIEGASQIEVSLTDGTRIPAKLLGTDVITDLALLEMDGEQIDTVAEFGNSELLRVGEPAIAIGNPLGLRFSSSVTQGIISATERSIPVDLTGNGQIDWHAEVLQTDAAINPGNSGGALINIEGKVIGINSMKIAQQSVEGIGFAIPTDIVLPVLSDLEKFGEVQRPQLGVGIRSLAEIPSFHWQETLKLPKEVKSGVLVSSVAPMSPAERAGLKEYDVIIDIDGKKIEDSHQLRKFLYTEVKIGDKVEVTYYREGKKAKTTVQLAEQQSY